MMSTEGPIKRQKECLDPVRHSSPALALCFPSPWPGSTQVAQAGTQPGLRSGPSLSQRWPGLPLGALSTAQHPVCKSKHNPPRLQIQTQRLASNLRFAVSKRKKTDPEKHVGENVKKGVRRTLQEDIN